MSSSIQPTAGCKIVSSCITCPSMIERMNCIKHSPLGVDLTEQDCLDVASRARLETYGRGEPLFMQGDPGRELFLVRTGHIKLTQLSSSGSEVLLWVCGEGSVLGILSAMNSRPYSCSAQAVMASTIWAWDQTAISYVMKNHPRLHHNLSTIVSDRVQELEERFRELATENVSRRLALTLLRLSEGIGRQGPRGIEISLSREEMAQMTGTTLFSVSRTLSKWARNKLVVARRQSVVIPDLRLIESVARAE